MNAIPVGQLAVARGSRVLLAVFLVLGMAVYLAAGHRQQVPCHMVNPSEMTYKVIATPVYRLVGKVVTGFQRSLHTIHVASHACIFRSHARSGSVMLRILGRKNTAAVLPMLRTFRG